jgi:ribosomal protein S18 acetylase RimI-like enzyme
MTQVRTVVESPASAAEAYEAVCALFASVFGAPPLSRPAEALAQQRDSLRSLMAEPSFGMATAWDDDALVGFAYGYALNSGSRWWNDMLAPVADEVTREWDGRTFVIIDMAVARQHQGQGIGRRLLDTLMAARPEERASLSVVPDNDRAHGFYRHLGWQHVGQVRGAPHHTAPFFDIYLLKLS